MRKSIITLGLIAGALVAATFPGIAAAQDGTQPVYAPPPGPPPPPPADPNAPSGAVARTGVVRIDAPPLTGISVFGIVGYGDAFGAGVRYMLPLPIPSLLTHTPLRDSWAIEFGADLLYWTDYVVRETELIPIVGVMWNVWLTPDFAVYPKVEAGFGFDVAGNRNGVGAHDGFYPTGAAGLLYRVSNAVTLRAEVGATGLRGGAGFFF